MLLPSPLSGHLPAFWPQQPGSKVWLMQEFTWRRASCPPLGAHPGSMQDNMKLLPRQSPRHSTGAHGRSPSRFFSVTSGAWPSSRAALNESFPQILLRPQPGVEETQKGAWEGAGITEPSLGRPQTGQMCLQKARGLEVSRKKWGRPAVAATQTSFHMAWLIPHHTQAFISPIPATCDLPVLLQIDTENHIYNLVGQPYQS